MNPQQIARIAPTAILLAFLVYSTYSLESSLPGASERQAEIASGVEVLINELATVGAEVANLEGRLRDPFRIVVPPAPEGEVEATVAEAAEPAPDPLEAIVAGLNLETTFVQGKDQIAIINGRIYSKGQPLVINDPRTPDARLVLLFVKPMGVILRGEGKNYSLGYPDRFARKEPAGAPPADPAALDLGGQAEMLRKLLDSPLGVLGKGLMGGLAPMGASSKGTGSRGPRHPDARPPDGAGN